VHIQRIDASAGDVFLVDFAFDARSVGAQQPVESGWIAAAAPPPFAQEPILAAHPKHPDLVTNLAFATGAYGRA
jgi:hypothetical protein